jgi:RimJ/RimL family protein N-acetyltransferase
VRYYGDRYYTLTRPAKRFENACVRQLSIEDLPLLKASPEFARAAGFGGPQQLLEESFMACGIVDGKIVASAQAYARSERHADIGVVTLDGYRGHGLATTAASIVAQRLQEAGEIPLWSTGEDNYASQRIAEKLGFTEAGRRVYVIVEK